MSRWPAVLAVACAALFLAGDDPAAGLGEILLLLPLVYLLTATLGDRRAAWSVLAGGVFAGFAAKTFDLMPQFLVAAALALLLFTALTGKLHKPSSVRLQALGMVAFGLLAVVALLLNPDVGRYLVAAGWLLHGAWDFTHLRRGAVVSRSYAEWCGVVDVLVGIGLLVL